MPAYKRMEFIQWFQNKTKSFAVAAIKFSHELPEGEIAEVMARHLTEAAGKMAAAYRAASRTKSRTDYRHKIGFVNEELENALFWLDLLKASPVSYDVRMLELLQKEAQAISKIIGVSNQPSLN